MKGKLAAFAVATLLALTACSGSSSGSSSGNNNPPVIPGNNSPSTTNSRIIVPGDTTTTEGHLPPTDSMLVDAYEGQLLDPMVSNLHALWNQLLNGNSPVGTAPVDVSVNYIWLSEGESVDCHAITGETVTLTSEQNYGPFYCWVDDIVILPTDFMIAVTGAEVDTSGNLLMTDLGKAATVFVLGHEYSHNIDTELYGLDYVSSLPTLNFELHADCMTGWFISAIGLPSVAVEGTAALLDFLGTLGEDPTHGTPEQRMTAVITGHDAATAGLSFDGCDSYLMTGA